MQVGTWIEWNAEDFSHRGVITKMEGAHITMLSATGGMMTFADTDGTIAEIKEPKKVPAGKPTVAVAQPVAKEKQRKANGPTKQEQAHDIIEREFKKSGVIMSRQDGIKLLMVELSTTKDGASTFFAAAKKRLTVTSA